MKRFQTILKGSAYYFRLRLPRDHRRNGDLTFELIRQMDMQSVHSMPRLAHVLCVVKTAVGKYSVFSSVTPAQAGVQP